MDRDAVFARFRDKVSVDREGLTYVIDIGFKSQDPEKAARIVRAIVARYKASLSGEKETANSEANNSSSLAQPTNTSAMCRNVLPTPLRVLPRRSPKRRGATRSPPD